MTESTISDKSNRMGVVRPDYRKNVFLSIGGHLKTGHPALSDQIFKELCSDILISMIFISFFLFLLFL